MKATGANVLVELIHKEKKKTVIELPDDNSNYLRGKVVSIGECVKEIVAGEIVSFKNSGNNIMLEDSNMCVVNIGNIFLKETCSEI